jgi:quercetin dioxygenase-like cupin family protein
MARDLDEKFPGLREHMPEASGMHTTPTVDLGIVLEGEVVLELANGAEKRLGRGDAYVMNGTAHSWHNRTDEVTVIACVLIGADSIEG